MKARIRFSVDAAWLYRDRRRCGSGSRASGVNSNELTASPRYAALYPLLLTSMRGAATTYLIDRRDPLTDPHLPLWRDLTRTYLLGDAGSADPSASSRRSTNGT